MANSVVFPRAQFFSNSGRPLVGGRIHTYVAGSSTRARTYQDAANVQINTNPIILDARGEAAIYLAEGVEYKFVVEDSTGALIMTQEPVYGAIWPNASGWPSDTTLSYQYMTEARAAASATGPIKFFDTKAQADAAIGTMANGDIIEVSQDETRAGARTRYKVQAGALVFLVNLDQTKLDLAAATGASLVGFQQVGTGAVSTTVQRKLRETVSVNDFGAIGDGVADDTAAIQAALASGKAIYFPQPQAFYNVTANLTINSPVEAGLYRVFGGSGTITLGANSVTEVHPHWWGAEATQVSTIDTTVAAKNTAAFNAAFSQGKYVVLPGGNYQINGTIYIKDGCRGAGQKTVFYPTGNFTATSVLKISFVEIGEFSVNYGLVGNSSSNVCVHIALGSAIPNDQTVSCRLHHIVGLNCYRVVQYLSADAGVSWNMTLDCILGFNCSDRVIFFEADSASSTLITIKNTGSILSPTGKGIYAVNMSEIHIYDCFIDSGASGDGSLLDCFASNIDVDGFHVEGHVSTISDGSGAPIKLRASQGGVTVKNLYFAGWTFTPGSAVPVFYMRCEGKVEIGSVAEVANVVNNSATKYIASLLGGVTAFTAAQHSPADFYVAPITASYGVEPAAENVSVGTSETTLLTTPLGGSFQVSQQCGLFLVNGVWGSDMSVAFTDLILITATGANARTIVTLSSNSINGAHTRTYSISGADIKLALATGTYLVSIKGLMMPRSRA